MVGQTIGGVGHAVALTWETHIVELHLRYASERTLLCGDDVLDDRGGRLTCWAGGSGFRSFERLALGLLFLEGKMDSINESSITVALE